MAKKCKYSHSGPTNAFPFPSAACVCHKRNDGHVRSDRGRLSGKPSIHQPAPLPEQLFLFQHLHAYLNPFAVCFMFY